MRYQELGNSDLSVSAIGFGCWGISDRNMWGLQDERDSIAALQSAADSGITFFDTAEMYGDGYSERLVGKALASRRRGVVIATKVSAGHLSAGALIAACERSLARFATDVIDVYQIHWPSPAADFDGVADSLMRLQAQGKIRYAGVCNHGESDLSRYPDGLFVSNQVAYSLAFRAAEFEILPASQRRRMSIIPYSGLLHGVLTGKYRTASDVPAGRARTRHFSSARLLARHGGEGYERHLFELIDDIRSVADGAALPMRTIAILWLTSRSGVATVPIGSRTADQAMANARLGDMMLDQKLLDRLDEVSDALKDEMGPNADMWQNPGRIGCDATGEALQ